MKKIIYFLIILFITGFLASCNTEYDGKKIDSIEYGTIDYMGGYRKNHKIDFISNTVLYRGFLPDEVETIPKYEVLYTFAEEDEKSLLMN